MSRRSFLRATVRLGAVAAVGELASACGLVGPARGQGSAGLTILGNTGHPGTAPSFVPELQALVAAYPSTGGQPAPAIQLAEPSLVAVLANSLRDATPPGFDLAVVTPAVRNLPQMPRLFRDMSADLSKAVAGLSPALVSYAQVGARLCFCPLVRDPLVLFYNADILERAGINTPLEQITFNEFLVICQQLGAMRSARTLQAAPLANATNTYDAELCAAFVVGFGGKLISPDGQSCAFDGPNGLEGLSALISLHAFESPVGSRTPLELFSSGQAVMAFGHFADVAALTAGIGNLFAWSATSIPVFPSRAATPVRSTGIGLTSWSKQAAQAVSFDLWSLSGLGQTAIARAGAIPALSAVATTSWRPPLSTLSDTVFVDRQGDDIAVPWVFEQLPQPAQALAAAVRGTPVATAFEAAAAQGDRVLATLNAALGTAS